MSKKTEKTDGGEYYLYISTIFGDTRYLWEPKEYDWFGPAPWTKVTDPVILALYEGSKPRGRRPLLLGANDDE